MNPNVDLRQLAVNRAPPPQGGPAPSRHLITRYLLPGGVLCGFLAVGAWAARDSLMPSHPVTVVPVLTTRAEIEQAGAPLFQAAGWIEPRPTPTLVPALAEGVVEKLLVVEGQEVKAGEVVALLVADDAKLALKSAAANLRQREAEADTLPAKAEADLKFLPFQVQTAEARQKLARIDLESKKNLTSSVPLLTLHRAESELAMAAAAVDELALRKQRLDREVISLRRLRAATAQDVDPDADKQPLTEPESNMKVAMTRVWQAQVALAAARLRLERMTVTAPIAGKVLALHSRPGMRLMGLTPMAHQEASSVVSLYDPAQLQVRADVRFEDLPRVQPGQPITIESPAVPGSPLPGEVLFPTSQADIQKNTLQVKVSIKAPPAVLKPDMLVQVTFLAVARPASNPEGTEPLRLLVPRSLVQVTDGTAKVWLADQVAGLARQRVVKLGTGSNGDLVEITDGLTPADKLIAGGRDSLRDGQRITVVGEDAALSATMRDSGPKPSRLPRPASADGGHQGKH